MPPGMSAAARWMARASSSVRGDIVDIYAPDMRQPARVEYWDDEIDSLASFDLLTQRRDGSLEKIYLSPAREVLFGNTVQTAEALRDAWKKARGKHRAALEKAMEADLAQLDSGLMPEAMDKYLGAAVRMSPATVLEHLDRPHPVVLDERRRHPGERPGAGREVPPGEELTGLLEAGRHLAPGMDVLYEEPWTFLWHCGRESTEHGGRARTSPARHARSFELADLGERGRPSPGRPGPGRRAGLPAGRAAARWWSRGYGVGGAGGHPQAQRGGAGPGPGRSRLCGQHEPGRPPRQRAGAESCPAT